MALTDKEIEYLKSELPEGMRVVDFREINNIDDFIERYGLFFYKSDTTYLSKMRIALNSFIENVKTKK